MPRLPCVGNAKKSTAAGCSASNADQATQPPHLSGSTPEAPTATSPIRRETQTWGICTRRAGKPYSARSRLFRSKILKVNTKY